MIWEEKVCQILTRIYDMAVSWQRLIDGKNIEEMDLVMINHELMEYDLMANKRLSYKEAHTLTDKKYNYSKYIKELKLKEFNDEYVVYLYQPEGKGEYGEVVYIFADNEAKIIKKAEESSDWYANKAMSKISECIRENNLPIKFTQAWY
jgi:hypothetical protein